MGGRTLFAPFDPVQPPVYRRNKRDQLRPQHELHSHERLSKLKTSATTVMTD
jgi:hypothetical protein